MVVIDNIVRPREDVLTEGIDGIVHVYKALSGEGIEGDAERFLEVTYLTDPLKEVLNEIKVKLDGKKRSRGVYVFSGGYVVRLITSRTQKSSTHRVHSKCILGP